MSTEVNISNFARAETDTAIKKLHHLAGGFGRWFHLRQPVPLDQQEVIRMNRDTLYSGAVLDLSRPAIVTMPGRRALAIPHMLRMRACWVM